ncbi:MAG: alanine racemase [Balneolaceae bacterium]
MLHVIERPVLFIDEERCKRNIKRMADKATQNNCEFRPHFKTHQSIKIGRWIRNTGVTGITVSTPEMAQYFADDGWDDITIAFPFHPSQLNALLELEKKCDLQLFVNSEEHLRLLNSQLRNPFKWYIETDPDYGRSGIHYMQTGIMKKLIELSELLEKCRFEGFYIHDGRTYKAKSKSEVTEKIEPVIGILNNLKDQFPSAKISLGDTPSASCLDHFNSIDILTPGNFVFYDWMQVQIGSCSLDDVAVFVLLPVAQHIKSEKRLILHGGAVHLSKDFIVQSGRNNYGQVINYAQDESIHPESGLFLSSLSQEHGTINYKSGFPEQFSDSQYLWICPIHSCLTVNLFDHYTTREGNRIEKRILS